MQKTTSKKTVAKKRTSKKHPGFTREAEAVAHREGVSNKSARSIVASSTRKASPSAKRKNPRLKRVKGK